MRALDDALVAVHYEVFIPSWTRLQAFRRGESIDTLAIEWKVTAQFEAAHPDYLWLNTAIVTGRGAVTESGGFRYRFFELA